MANPRIKGIVWAVISMFFWASSFPVGRTLISRGMVDPVTLGMLRFGTGGLLMLAAGRLMRQTRLFTLSRTDAFRVAFLGLLGTALMGLFLFTAQKTVSSVNSSMIEALSPLLIFILSAVSSRHFSFLQAFGLLFGFGGCLMVLKIIGFDGAHLDSYQFGDFLILCSSLCWSLYTVWGKPVVLKIGAYAFTAWTMTAGAVWLLLFNLFCYEEIIFPASGQAWGLIAYFAVFPTAVAFFAWNEAQNYISLALLSLSEYFTPLCTALLALAFLGEPVTAAQLTGAVIICGAVLIEPEILEMLPRRRKKNEEPADYAEAA